MALTPQDLDALDETIASGTLTCTFNGRTVTYQTTAALLQARAHVAAVLRSQAGSRGPTFGGTSYALADFSTD
mgnify:CR=1 FL=1